MSVLKFWDDRADNIEIVNSLAKTHRNVTLETFHVEKQKELMKQKQCLEGSHQFHDSYSHLLATFSVALQTIVFQFSKFWDGGLYFLNKIKKSGKLGTNKIKLPFETIAKLFDLSIYGHFLKTIKNLTF